MKFKKDLDGLVILYEQDTTHHLDNSLKLTYVKDLVNGSANSIKGKLVVRLGYFVFSIN